MQTTLETKVTRKSTIPNMTTQTHALPGYPHVLCVDVINTDNQQVPKELLHAMLTTKEAIPNLGADRTSYMVPADYDKIDILLTVGIINGADHVVVHMIIHLVDGSTMTHNHVACPFL